MEDICIFMEIRWINSSLIHTGGFFHGPFEITDTEIPFILRISEGPTRPLDEAPLSSPQKYAKRVEVLDAKDLGLSTIDQRWYPYFNHSCSTMWRCCLNHAWPTSANIHDATRRYMWKVEY